MLWYNYENWNYYLRHVEKIISQYDTSISPNPTLTKHLDTLSICVFYRLVLDEIFMASLTPYFLYMPKR